jgi:ABC-type glycerol-3-phosphate transport system substrate-binding protein
MRTLRSSLSFGVIMVLLATACMGGPAVPSSSQSAPAAGSTGWQAIVDKAKTEGTLLVYAQWFTGTEATTIAEEFKRVSGIPVDFITGNGAVLVQRY